MDATVASPTCLVVGKDKEALANLEENNRLLEEVQKGMFGDRAQHPLWLLLPDNKLYLD